MPDTAWKLSNGCLDDYFLNVGRITSLFFPEVTGRRWVITAVTPLRTPTLWTRVPPKNPMVEFWLDWASLRNSFHALIAKSTTSIPLFQSVDKIKLTQAEAWVPLENWWGLACLHSLICSQECLCKSNIFFLYIGRLAFPPQLHVHGTCCLGLKHQALRDPLCCCKLHR